MKRHETETTGGCPFYSASLHFERGVNHGGVLLNSGGNQCALITSAHSPCWMEVGESRAPDWATCPRNPQWIATADNDLDWDRFTSQRDDLGALVAARVDAARKAEKSKRRIPS